MKNLIFLIFLIFLISCSNFKVKQKVRESLLAFSFVPYNHAIHGGKINYYVFVENLSSDTITWQKEGYIYNHIGIPIRRPIKILPREKIVKSFVFYLKKDELENVNKGIIPEFYLKSNSNNHTIRRDENFMVCNQVEQPLCFENIPDTSRYRIFHEAN